jgi:hypothetical protein
MTIIAFIFLKSNLFKKYVKKKKKEVNIKNNLIYIITILIILLKTQINIF